MAHKFLRDDGWFQFPTPADVGISTSTTTSLFGSLTATLSTATLVAGDATTGPSVAQGTVGVWYAAGNVTFNNASVAVNCIAKLTDGVTTVSAAAVTVPAANQFACATLAGVFSAPAGNIRFVASSGATATTVMLSTTNGPSVQTNLTSLTVVRIG